MNDDKPEFDVARVHRYFSADCFNKTWELIEKKDRTAADDEQMIQRCFASLWHWSQRPDCTADNWSIGYWQASRVFAILGRTDEARRYGQLCLQNCRADAPFLLGYAHEALARAEKPVNPEKSRRHAEEARRLALLVTEKEDQGFLLKDLETV